jgi:hypothetical protein
MTMEIPVNAIPQGASFRAAALIVKGEIRW